MSLKRLLCNPLFTHNINERRRKAQIIDFLWFSFFISAYEFYACTYLWNTFILFLNTGISTLLVARCANSIPVFYCVKLITIWVNMPGKKSPSAFWIILGEHKQFSLQIIWLQWPSESSTHCFNISFKTLHSRFVIISRLKIDLWCFYDDFSPKIFSTFFGPTTTLCIFFSFTKIVPKFFKSSFHKVLR